MWILEIKLISLKIQFELRSYGEKDFKDLHADFTNRNKNRSTTPPTLNKIKSLILF